MKHISEASFPHNKNGLKATTTDKNGHYRKTIDHNYCNETVFCSASSTHKTGLKLIAMETGTNGQ